MPSVKRRNITCLPGMFTALLLAASLSGCVAEHGFKPWSSMAGRNDMIGVQMNYANYSSGGRTEFFGSPESAARYRAGVAEGIYPDQQKLLDILKECPKMASSRSNMPGAQRRWLTYDLERREYFCQ